MTSTTSISLSISLSISTSLCLALVACGPPPPPPPRPTLTVTPANVCATTNVSVVAGGLGMVTVSASPQTSPPLTSPSTSSVHVVADNTRVTVTDTRNGTSASLMTVVHLFPGSVNLGGFASCVTTDGVSYFWESGETLSASDWAPQIRVDTVTNSYTTPLQIQAPNGTTVNIPPWGAASVGDQPIAGSWHFRRLLAAGDDCSTTPPLGSIVRAHCS